MPADTSQRIDALFAFAREHVETMQEQHHKIVPLVGFVRGNALVSAVSVPSGSEDDVAFACAVGSVGYRADGVFLLGEDMGAVSETNPLTGALWRDDEMADVLHLDGGLGVIARNISLAYLEKGAPFLMLSQEFAAAGDRLMWKDVFIHVETESTPLNDTISHQLRTCAGQPETVAGAARALDQIVLDSLLGSLTADSPEARDGATTRALCRRGLVPLSTKATALLTLPVSTPPRPS